MEALAVRQVAGELPPVEGVPVEAVERQLIGLLAAERDRVLIIAGQIAAGVPGLELVIKVDVLAEAARRGGIRAAGKAVAGVPVKRADGSGRDQGERAG